MSWTADGTRALDVDSRTAPSCRIHFRLELLPDPCPRSMQQHPLIAIGDAEQVADIGWSNSFDVAEHHHLALHVRQGRQDLSHPAGQAVGDHAVLDLVGPRHRR